MLQELYRGVLDILFPSFCKVCGSFLFIDHKFVVCSSCWSRGFKRASGEVEGSFPFKRAFYYTYYGGLPELLIKELKFKGRRQVAWEIGREISGHLREVISDTRSQVVVPVPIHRETLKERGFNQVEEILKGAGIGFSDVLERPYKGIKQSTLNLIGRFRNVEGLFKLKDGSKVKGKTVLLVDDIFTTGATACEISSLLRSSGAREVYVYCFAYTPLKEKGTGNFMGFRNR